MKTTMTFKGAKLIGAAAIRRRIAYFGGLLTLYTGATIVGAPYEKFLVHGRIL
jgi:hypothetical protein